MIYTRNIPLKKRSRVSLKRVDQYKQGKCKQMNYQSIFTPFFLAYIFIPFKKLVNIFKSLFFNILKFNIFFLIILTLWF